MREIAKLRQRLGNVSRNVTEFKMSVEEARLLLKEIDLLEEQLKEPVKTAVNVPNVITRTIDGGTF